MAKKPTPQTDAELIKSIIKHNPEMKSDKRALYSRYLKAKGVQADHASINDYLNMLESGKILSFSAATSAPKKAAATPKKKAAPAKKKAAPKKKATSKKK